MKAKLRELQSILRVSTWFKRTNKEIELLDVNGNVVVVPQLALMPYLTDFTSNMMADSEIKKNYIVGADKVKFELYFGNNLKHIQKTCKKIWNNPEDYYDFNGDSYYEFLKFLCVNINGREFRLCDIATIDNGSELTQEEFDKIINLEIERLGEF